MLKLKDLMREADVFSEIGFFLKYLTNRNGTTRNLTHTNGAFEEMLRA